MDAETEHAAPALLRRANHARGNMIKLFASDLDGTLLGAFHNVDAPVRAAVDEVVKSGAHFAIATGRSMRSNCDFGFDGLDVEGIGANGSVIYGRDGTVLKHFTMDPVALEEMLRAFPQVCFECVGVTHTYVTGSMERQQQNFRVDGPFRRIAMRGMRARRARTLETCLFDQPVDEVMKHHIGKVNTRVADPGLNAELKAFIAERSDVLVNAPFNPAMFEISDVGINKGVGVAWLARYLGFSEDEVAVYGDGGNDVTMLERFGHAYATRCACAEAKAAALEVVGSNVLYAVPRHMVRTVRAQQSAPAYTRID